jgi:DNA-binding PadR family transcriptional regulator
MDSYNVRYRLPNQFFFRTIKDLVQDGYLDENKNIRYFISKDKKRYEINATGVFEFSSSRADYIESLTAKREALQQESNEVIPGVPLPE